MVNDTLPQTFICKDQNKEVHYDVGNFIMSCNESSVYFGLDFSKSKPCILKIFREVENSFRLLRISYEQSMNDIFSYYPNQFITVEKIFHDKQGYIVMVTTPTIGTTLFTLVHSHSYIFNFETYYYGLKNLLIALKHLHNRNIIFMDVKLQNIFVEGSKDFKLFNFETCLHAINPNTFNIVGSNTNVTPEMLKYGSFQKKSDIWGLGLCFYEMVTKKHLFFNENLAELKYDILNKEITFPPGFNKQMMEICKCMLHRNPEERWTAEKLLDTLFSK